MKGTKPSWGNILSGQVLSLFLDHEFKFSWGHWRLTWSLISKFVQADSDIEVNKKKKGIKPGSVGQTRTKKDLFQA
jgi:hypothetical protein